jgi:hypothetical protein
LPNISDLLRKVSGFKDAMAIYLSMGYYHIPLDLELSHTIGSGSTEIVYNYIDLGQIPIQKVTNGCENKPRHISKNNV